MHPTNNTEAKKVGTRVRNNAKRKLKALRNNKPNVWFGLGMMGIVGWTIAVPTLLGAGLGVWFDEKFPQTFSWTLSGLILGLLAGCLIAWHWINKEHNEINQNNYDE